MFFVAKICKRALRASNEGYLAVAASTPTYSSLLAPQVAACVVATTVTSSDQLQIQVSETIPGFQCSRPPPAHCLCFTQLDCETQKAKCHLQVFHCDGKNPAMDKPRWKILVKVLPSPDVWAHGVWCRPHWSIRYMESRDQNITQIEHGIAPTFYHIIFSVSFISYSIASVALQNIHTKLNKTCISLNF